LIKNKKKIKSLDFNKLNKLTMTDKESDPKCCCVCSEEQDITTDIITNMYTECPFSHNICKTCYLSILQMCYCQNSLGEVLYKCPLCRNEHRISNKKMNIILLELTDSDEMCLRVHKTCETKNITKKCQFDNCGCRTNVIDIVTKDDIDLAIKDIINLANKYKLKDDHTTDHTTNIRLRKNKTKI